MWKSVARSAGAVVSPNSCGQGARLVTLQALQVESALGCRPELVVVGGEAKTQGMLMVLLGKDLACRLKASSERCARKSIVLGVAQFCSPILTCSS